MVDDYYYHGTRKENLANIKANGIKPPSHLTLHESVAAYYAAEGDQDGRSRGDGVVFRVKRSNIHAEESTVTPGEGHFVTSHVIPPQQLEIGLGRGKNGISGAKSWKALVKKSVLVEGQLFRRLSLVP